MTRPARLGAWLVGVLALVGLASCNAIPINIPMQQDGGASSDCHGAPGNDGAASVDALWKQDGDPMSEDAGALDAGMPDGALDGAIDGATDGILEGGAEGGILEGGAIEGGVDGGLPDATADTTLSH